VRDTASISAVEVVDLHRTYVTRVGVWRRERVETLAVNGVSLDVGVGETFGLIGPNGAGKTTLIKILNTLLLPTSGSARVLGHDVVSQTHEVRRRIGCVFGGDRGLYERLSGRDNLRYFAELYGMEPATQTSRISEVLELVGLRDRGRERVEGYSRGMRQRLHIARGILHDPQVLFLDEPTIGLDPVGARELRAAISQLAALGKTILLTTHYMLEADELCDRVGVIADGRILAEGTPAELKATGTPMAVIEVEARGVDDSTLGRLREIPGVVSLAVESRDHTQVVMLHTGEDPELTASVARTVESLGLGRARSREPTLEDVYIAIVTRTRS
jgi:ABC-2 type transport system ATP-binding protein